MQWINFAANVLTLLAMGYFVRQKRASLRLEQDIWDILQVAKDYKEIGRVQHVEADAAREDAKKTAVEISKRVESKADELATKIDAVPDRVAEKIAGASDSGHTLPAIKPGSGRNQVPQPPEGAT
jgi:major membrane immunogen (membrane-anchored lipoprotein)